MHVIDYMFKGSMVQAGHDGETERFTFRLFDSLGDRYWLHDPYFTIGVGITVGIRDVHERRVQYGVSSISPGSRFTSMVPGYIKNSAFTIITWRSGSPDGVHALLATISRVRSWVSESVIGIAMYLDEAEDDWYSIVEGIERAARVPCITERDHAAFLHGLLEAAMRPEPCTFLLPVHSLDELHSLRPRVNASSFRNPASRKLRDLILRAGFQFIGNESILMEKYGWAFKIDLDDAKVHIAHRYCAGCRKFPGCSSCFANLCIVQATHEGFASNQTDLEPGDLFYLSIIYAIDNDQLPAAVLEQFPRRGPCFDVRFK
jgi:hypothetical protein